MVTFLSSSGARRLSRMDLGASQNSSRKRTPFDAKLTSPGRMFSPLPPPSKAGLEADMCGARKGLVRMSPTPPALFPATE